MGEMPVQFVLELLLHNSEAKGAESKALVAASLPAGYVVRRVLLFALALTTLLAEGQPHFQRSVRAAQEPDRVRGCAHLSDEDLPTVCRPIRL